MQLTTAAFDGARRCHRRRRRMMISAFSPLQTDGRASRQTEHKAAQDDDEMKRRKKKRRRGEKERSLVRPSICPFRSVPSPPEQNKDPNVVTINDHVRSSNEVPPFCPSSRSAWFPWNRVGVWICKTTLLFLGARVQSTNSVKSDPPALTTKIEEESSVFPADNCTSQ